MAPIKKTRIIDDLLRIGLTAGDTVVVHSSMRKLGPVEGGADTVINALLEVLGAGGNLVLPTFSYARYAIDSCFDPSSTPCKTGILNEIGRQRKGTVRSLHPTHSIAVIGPEAARLTEAHLEHRTFGIGSPIDRAHTSGSAPYFRDRALHERRLRPPAGIGECYVAGPANLADASGFATNIFSRYRSL